MGRMSCARYNKDIWVTCDKRGNSECAQLTEELVPTVHTETNNAKDLPNVSVWT
jgi:hypothetical protein